jgi:hypothetical protein
MGKARQDGGRRTVWGCLGPLAVRGPGARSTILWGKGGEAASRVLAVPGSPTGDTRVTGEVLWCPNEG